MNDQTRDEFAKLVETVAKLRSPEGCPWDREQTHESLKRYAIEETYELVEAIESGDAKRLEDELGDVLLQVLLHAQMASERCHFRRNHCHCERSEESALHEDAEKQIPRDARNDLGFDIADVCRTLREKLLRRHPHVFADTEVSGVEDVLHNWEQIKREEPGYDQRESVLDGVPESLPALMRAAKISKKAARAGFEWPDIHAVFGKLHEEIRELEEAIDRGSDREIKNEIGDLLFTAVNIARWAKVDPEEALRDMLKKFAFRFSRIEERARETGRDIHEMTLEEMDRVWEDAK